METTPAPAPAPEILGKAQPPKFVRWAILLGIVIVLNIVFFVVRGLVFAEPQYDTFCPASKLPQPVTEKTCTDVDGVWTNYDGTQTSDEILAPSKSQMIGQTGFCDTYSKCQPLYDEARKEFSKKAFIFMIVAGVVALIAGILPLGSSIVSAGLSYGGVLAFIIGSATYWGEAGSYLRLLISLLALIVLIGIGIRHFKD